MDKLDLLKKVQRVDAPPFLLTRIKATIRASAAERLPLSWQWTGALAFALLLVLHALALTPKQATTGQLAESLGLHTSNQLYDE